jgi:hypothetical protein
MMNKTSRAIAAFLVAPCAPTTVYGLYLQAVSTPRMHVHAGSVVWGTASLIFWSSLIFTLPITLAIGLPAYHLIQKHTRLRLQHVLGLSGAVGGAVGLLASVPVHGALLGLSAGITFWLIWYRERDETRPF